MKRICLVLLVVFLLFSGCVLNGVQNEPITSQKNTSDFAETEENNTIGIKSPVGKNAPKFVPLGKDLFLVQPCFDLDLYMKDLGGIGYVTFELLSKQPLNTAELSVAFPELKHHRAEIEIEELRFDGSTCGVLQDMSGKESVASEELFSYPLYLCYQNTDWSALAGLAESARKQEAVLAERRASGAEQDVIAEAEAALGTAQNAYYDALYAKKDTYCAISLSELPQFYYYCIHTDFSADKTAEAETVTTAELRIGAETHAFSLGQIRLQAEAPVRSEPVGNEMEYASAFIYPEYRHCGYVDGRCLDPAFALEPSPTATQITLERYSFYREDVKASDFHIWLGNGMDFAWDGNSPVTISTGDALNMTLTMQSANLLRPYANYIDFGIVDYTCNGKHGTLAIPIFVQYRRLPYELYAECFDGVDLEAYYEKFYVKFVDMHGVNVQ